MSQENGGAAFPQEVRYVAPNGQSGSYGPSGGMTLRDYFAAKAMLAGVSDGREIIDCTIYATWCYKMADAMLEARK